MENRGLVAPQIEEYAARHTTPLSSELAALQAETERTMGMHARMVSGQVEGTFLQILALSVGARRILEIGTFTGFSALMMASVLPDDGELVTCEINPDAAAMAQRAFDGSVHGKKVRVRLGPALETLRDLQGPFELVFIDAANEQYVDYYEASLPLLASNGAIVVDNVLHRGEVLDPQSPSARATVAFNDLVQADPRVVNALLTLRDGVMLIRRR